jgi:hypothetical protein
LLWQQQPLEFILTIFFDYFNLHRKILASILRWRLKYA